MGLQATQSLGSGATAYVQAHSTVSALPASFPPAVAVSTPTLGAGLNYGPAGVNVSVVPGQAPTYGTGISFKF